MTLLTLRHSKLRLTDRYTLQECLGVGGSYEVWRATDHYSDTAVAIKFLGGKAPQDLRKLQNLSERLVREGETLRRLNHPRIVRVIEIDEERPFLVLELLLGRTLGESNLGQDCVRVAKLGIQICSALIAIHEIGIVHRDVNPSNLMVNGKEAAVIDLSIAQSIGEMHRRDDITQTGAIVGSRGYFSPEQARGEVVAPTSDIFSLGIVLFQQLTGESPFSTDPHHLSKFRGDVRLRTAETMIQAMLAESPAARPTLQQVQTTLLGFLPD